MCDSFISSLCLPMVYAVPECSRWIYLKAGLPANTVFQVSLYESAHRRWHWSNFTTDAEGVLKIDLEEYDLPVTSRTYQHGPFSIQLTDESGVKIPLQLIHNPDTYLVQFQFERIIDNYQPHITIS